MKLPFVSRERHEELRAAHMDLLERYHALLAGRSTTSPRAPRPVKPPRDQMIDKLAADLANALRDEGAARAEAERIKREAFGG